MDDFDTIFPDRNRNGGGPQFYHHIVQNINPSYEEFLEYNKFYCPVSGSLINPGEKPDYIYVKELRTQKNICGELYRCCWPCSCDLMNYTKVQKIKHKFKDGPKKIDVLVILLRDLVPERDNICRPFSDFSHCTTCMG